MSTMADGCFGIPARTATGLTATRLRESIWAAAYSAGRKRIRISCRSSARASRARRCPPAIFPTAQAEQIVAYLRSVAAGKRSGSASGLGAIDRGRAVFEGKGACTTCHRVNGTGARLGPDLSNIGQLRRAVELERRSSSPAAEVLATNRIYRVVTKDGATTTGTAAESRQLHRADARLEGAAAIVREVRRCASYGFVDQSPMPSYKDKLNAQELADVVSYLVSLKGKVTP